MSEPTRPRADPPHRLRHRGRAPLRLDRHGRQGLGRRAGPRRASSPSPAASTPPCIAGASGPCGSTPASARRRSPTRGSATCWSSGQTGLSVAFDLPTQMGYDSDHPLAEGEVGKVGVAIDSLARHGGSVRRHPAGQGLHLHDHQRHGGRPAAACTSWWPRSRASTPGELRGTIQNDILKEYIARGTYIFPPRPSMRLITDIFAYCRERLPRWNTISISGYHIREAGSTAVQELAFTLANGIAYVQAALDAGLDVDEFAPQLSFFFNAHNNFFEEVAKFRAARRIWAELMRERFGAKDPESQMLRFHTQTAGATLTAQQPDNNIVRVALQALAAVLGGTQSLHTNSFDEALALPTEESVTIALRTQQIIASRERRGRHGRPAGRLLRRGVPHRRGRGHARWRSSSRSTRWAARCAPSSWASCSGTSRRRPTSTSAPSSGARGPSSG